MAADAYYFDPKADIFDKVAAALLTATGRKSYFQEQSKNHALERWDWEPQDGAAFGPNSPGHHPQKVMNDVEWRARVACRGKTYGDAWLMLQQLITACRQVKCAAFAFEGHSHTESSDQAATLKNVVYAMIVFRMPILEQALGSGTKAVTIAEVDFDKTPPPDGEYGVDDGILRAPLG